MDDKGKLDKENFPTDNEFDRTMKKLLESICDITPMPRPGPEYGKVVFRRLNALEGMSKKDKVIYFAKKDGKDVQAALAKHEEQVKKNIEYTEKVHGYTPPRKNKPLDKSQLMPLETAKAVFWKSYLSMSLQPKAFTVDDCNGSQIVELIKYFIKDPSCKLDLNKGICLIGGIGTGKSILMKQFSNFTIEYKLDTAFVFTSMESVIRDIARNGIGVIDEYLIKDICFDDIAVSRAGAVMKSYGTEINALSSIIHGRYERFTKSISRPTHFTSNLNFNPKNSTEIEMLKSLYDEREIDRIGQMCNFVYLGGKSRRI